VTASERGGRIAGMADKPLYRQPEVRVRVWGISASEINRDTGHTLEEQRGDMGTSFEVNVGAPSEQAYAVDGFVTEREIFMATLQFANTRQLNRIARALEKLAGLEHDEPADWLDVMKPKET